MKFNNPQMKRRINLFLTSIIFIIVVFFLLSSSAAYYIFDNPTIPHINSEIKSSQITVYENNTNSSYYWGNIRADAYKSIAFLNNTQVFNASNNFSNKVYFFKNVTFSWAASAVCSVFDKWDVVPVCASSSELNNILLSIRISPCWVVANGTSQKGVIPVDLRDKFIVGADNSYSLGASAGSPTHIHYAGNLLTNSPVGTITIKNASSGANVVVASSTHYHTLYSSSYTTGNSSIPPYFACIFKQWICDCSGLYTSPEP